MHRNARFRQVALATALVSALGAVTAFGVAPLTQVEIPPAERITEPVLLGLPLPDPVDRFMQTETIRRGDTMAVLLGRIGANDGEFLRFVVRDPVARKALQLRAGRDVQVEIDSLGRVVQFSYRLGGLEEGSGDDSVPSKRIEIRRDGDRLVASQEDIPLERSVEMRSVEIRSSLFAATDAADIPENVAIKIAEIFGGDIDFQRDLRKGDQLRVLYETVREADGLDAPAGSRVIAVEIVNDGKRHSAFLFERNDGSEYFSFDGRSLKKAFLRNPLEFSRITSGFSLSRLHPISHDWRAHRGVDFGAPTGTRVRATADGTVEFIGQQRGYGNVVMIDHRGGYSTVYAHLNGFQPGLRRGSTIRQGDNIGFVGSTGWATGPHLHYELKIRGNQVDPMRVALPDSKALDGAEEQRLRQAASVVARQLAELDTVRLASFE
jgi:murein DD-endopeptidase MepM/ murein hydrolase activator NlpD